VMESLSWIGKGNLSSREKAREEMALGEMKNERRALWQK
jgi:hypothetical protein